MTKKERRFLKRIAKKEIARKSHGDRYAVALQDKPRRIGDYDGYTEYGFYEAEGYTDEEITEFLNDEYRIPAWFSPYDCTGMAFTVGIEWHRNPCGWISFRHIVGIDV